MQKISQNNPFSILCSSMESNDLDKNFVQALEAMLFLNKNGIDQKINEKYELRINFKVDYQSEKEKWFKYLLSNGKAKKQFQESDEDEEFDISLLNNGLPTLKDVSEFRDGYACSESYNIGDFLIRKLSQNLRRLYSAHRRGGKLPKELGSSLEKLKEQQSFIYNSLKMVSPYLHYDSQEKVFDNLFLGRARHCTTTQAFFYLSLHEHVLPSNESIHQEIFKNFMNKNDISPAIINDIGILTYNDKKSKFMEGILQEMPEQFFASLGFHILSQRPLKGSFVTDSFFHCIKHNLDIPNEHKLLFLKNVLTDHSHLSKTEHFHTQEISKKILSYMGDINIDKILEDSVRNTANNPNGITEISLSLINKLKDPNIFLSVLLSPKSHHCHTKILNKFDLSDQNLLFTVGRKILLLGKDSRKEKMTKFLSVTGENLENDTIGKLIASDVSLIEIFNPLFLSRKIGEELSEKKEINQIPQKRMKV